MKKTVKIFLLLLISFCYGNTIFEFLDTEKKSNFENESHTYIQQSHSHDFVKQNVPLGDFNIISNPTFDFGALPISRIKIGLYFCNHFYLPPNKLYLLHSTFLI